MFLWQSYLPHQISCHISSVRSALGMADWTKSHTEMRQADSELIFLRVCQLKLEKAWTLKVCPGTEEPMQTLGIKQLYRKGPFSRGVTGVAIAFNTSPRKWVQKVREGKIFEYSNLTRPGRDLYPQQFRFR